MGDLGVQRLGVGVDGEEVVATAGGDGLGLLGKCVEGIGGDHAGVEIAELVEEVGQVRNLVGSPQS